MLKLVVCIMILAAVRCAQEHHTSLRTDDALKQQNTLTPQRALKDHPGKQGSKGHERSRGSPGHKGEPGIPDDNQIKLLRNQFNLLSQKVEALKNKSRENQQNKRINLLFQQVEALKNKSRENQQNKQINSLFQKVETLTNKSRENQQNERLNYLFQEMETLKNKSSENQQNKRIHSLSQEVGALKKQSRQNQKFLEVFGNGLYVAPHVYIYQLTPAFQSWQESQRFCQNWGGTLAVFGVKTLENRKKLIQSLHIKDYFWIGANDIASEGNWIWVNGERASSSELIWWSGQPDNFWGNQDCVDVGGASTFIPVGKANDNECWLSQKGLCEKRI